MTENHFSLIPFPDPEIPDIQISGRASRENNLLYVACSLTGGHDKINIPQVALQPMRRDELWKESCFEFFLAIREQLQYWEFNMSPSGHWNIYHMDEYRRVGFREETAYQRLQFSVRREAGCVSVNAMIDLSPIVDAPEPIQLGIASIIQARDGHQTYWALAHPGPQADFHLRDSFSIQM
jgi:hypothetical protein